MKRSTVVLAVILLLLVTFAGLFLIGGTLSAQVTSVPAPASSHPEAFAAIRKVLSANAAPQRFVAEIPSDIDACRLEDVTITLSNRGLFPAEWLSVEAEGTQGDIAVYSLSGEGSTVGARSMATLNLKFISTANAQGPRTFHIQYYVYGMKRSITVHQE